MYDLDLADIGEMCQPVNMLTYVSGYAGWSDDYVARLHHVILRNYNSDVDGSKRRKHMLMLNYASDYPYAVMWARMYDTPINMLRSGTLALICKSLVEFYNKHWSQPGEHVEFLADMRELMRVTAIEYETWYNGLSEVERVGLKRIDWITDWTR